MRTIDVLALASAAASAVTAGAFVAFSTLVMPALDKLPPAQAVRAMQEINLIAPRGAFMLPLMGSALGCALVAVLAVVRRLGSSSGASGLGFGLTLAGGGVGVVAFLVTGMFAVPRNDRLAAMDAASADAARAWADYSGPWTAGNSVRAALAFVAAVLLVAGVVAAREE
ncbi:MAG: anthrone oxygenase family protein [Kineosporiaceae bacterium]